MPIQVQKAVKIAFRGSVIASLILLFCAAGKAYAFQTVPLSGNINVGASQTYSSLTNASGLFAAVNSVGLSGNLVVRITSDLTEDGTNALGSWPETGQGNYTITIQADGAVPRLISGNAANGLIRFNGAKRVTIDGNNGSGSSLLTIRNTNTAISAGTAISFINGASSNRINYCNLQAAANATNGAVLFGTATAATGNNNNIISNSAITATVGSNTGITCIYSAGENTGNTISSNNIANFRERAVDLAAANSGWIITGNQIFNGDATALLNFANCTTLHGIRIAGGSGYRISTNVIGGNAVQAGGTIANYSSSTGLISYQGILLTSTSASPVSEIKDNSIANISVSAVPLSTTALNVFTGIETNGAGILTEGNLIGSRTTRGSILVTTTTTSATFRSFVSGIHFKSTGGSLATNQVGGIDVVNIGVAAGPSTINCFLINSASPPPTISGNIAGSTTLTNSVRVLASSLSTATELSGITLGQATAGNLQINANTVQNISYLPTTGAGTISGISGNGITGSSIAMTANTVSTLTMNAASGVLNGVFFNGTASQLNISSNNISSNQHTGTTGVSSGINCTGGSIPLISVVSNTISANSASNILTGITNAATGTTLNINGNTIAGSVISSGTGIYTAVLNSAEISGSINIRSNNIGTAELPAVTFSSANSGAQTIISNTGGSTNSSLTISANNIRGLTYSIAGTGSIVFISNTAASLSRSISGNIFTALDLNTSGNINFLSDNIAIAATGTQNINGNTTSGNISKAAGGTVTIFSSTVNSATGSVSNQNNNNFSNITLAGATVMNGWTCTDAGASTKNIQNNIFSNWSGASGGITALSVNISGTNATSSNIIGTIAGTGNVTGISTAAGNDNIFQNTVFTLSSSGTAAVVSGIAVTAGTTKTILRNKLYDFTSSSATGSVNGILVSAGTTVNIANNIIGDLKAPAGNSATDLIRGISIPSTLAPSSINVFFNTVYMNASSSGTNFSTSGLYHTGSSNFTLAMLDLRNNSITNISTPKGTGNTAAYRNSASPTGNFATASNNNMFYAGTPGAARLIYTDGSAADQTIGAYRLRMLIREIGAISEDVTAKFQSTTGSSPLYLHMSATVSSGLDNAGSGVSGYTDDFDGQPRAFLPDIGADEINAAEVVLPVITYTALDNTTSTANRTLTNVTITDASGVNVTAGTKPRIYFKRSIDANQWIDNTSSSNGWKYVESSSSASPFGFTINYALLYRGESALAGVIQYFVVAQDLATVPNVNINSGIFNATPASVALSNAAFPLTGVIRSFNIPFAGAFPVGNTEVYATLTSANGIFATVNQVGLMANTTFNIVTDLTEDGANALNQWTESGTGNYTMNIQPDAGANRTIIGSVASALIRLNGADRVTIDGSQSAAGNYLYIRNTNTTGSGSAISMQNGATGNTIKNSTIESAGNQTNAVINFGTTSATGNSNNQITNCVINATVSSVQGITGIYSSGTTGNENISNTISNNIITGYGERAIDLTSTGSSGWTISSNKIYTASVSYNTAASLQGIRILGGTGYLIQNNLIGGSDTLGTAITSYTSETGIIDYAGIRLATSAATPASTISGNDIRNITISSLPDATNSRIITGIEASGAGIAIRNNLVRNLTNSGSSANGSLAISGIMVSGAASGEISGNRILNLALAATSGQTPGITGINVSAASVNVFNNALKLSNGTSSNAISIFGIHHNSLLASNYFFNTVSISGIGTTSIRSAAFLRSLTGTIILRNNILLNNRSGAGNNFAISNIASPPATGWAAGNSSNNNLYSTVENNLGEWGTGNAVNFANWKTAAQNDANSVNTNILFLESITDLVPDSVSNCAINNAGVTVSVTTDIRSITRNISTPDIGAYEFNALAFSVLASNNSPVCAGSPFQLSTTTGTAFSPTFRWTNAADSLISLLRTPQVISAGGLYKVTVTDSYGCVANSSTNVIVNPRPTARISAPAKVCEGVPANITLTVTGSGTISGTLATGTPFSGTAPTIVVPVSPTVTTRYYLATLSDANCAAIRVDIPDSVNVLVSYNGEWLGAVNTDWRTAGNWCGGVPTGTTNVLLPSSLSNYPVINTGINPALNLTIQSGASLTVTNAILQIAGSITNQGTITASNGTVEFNGSSAQTIANNVFAGNSLRGLTINNTSGVTLNGPLAITDLLTISSGQLNTNGNLTLKSTATGTARLGPVLSVSPNPVNGTVTVERYIPGRRKYRIITSSVTTSPAAVLGAGQELLSMWGNWQNQGNNVTAGIGNFITGGTVADGFDPQTQNPSVFTYDAVNRVFVPFNSANGNNTKTTPLKAGIPYYMFVFGDRRNTVITPTPGNTTLIAKGQLLTGNQIYTTASAIPLSALTGRFTMLGNPYASPINWASLTRTNLADTYWGWDPNLSSTGGYVTVSTVGNVVITAPYSGATGLNQFIQPGQGFFVRTTSASPSLIISESHKSATFNGNAFRQTDQTETKLIAVNLLYKSGSENILADGAVTVFGNDLSKIDAIKMLNNGENIGINYKNEFLSINARTPATKDTIALRITKLTKPTYELEIFTKGWLATDGQPYLEDRYLRTFTKLSLTDTNRIQININTGITASSDENRFRILLTERGITPIADSNTNTSPGLRIYPNPVKGRRLNIHYDGNTDVRFDLSLYNSLGIKVHQQPGMLTAGTGQASVNLDKKFTPGIYTAIILINNQRHIQKVMIE